MNSNMKLILFLGKDGLPHFKNFSAIQRMCSSCSIEFETTYDIERLKSSDYHILLTCFDFIDPDIIPNHVKIIYGPQFFIFPTGPIVGQIDERYKDRCVYNCLSTWNKHVYLECVHDFIVPLKELPFSVDTETFKPSDQIIPKEYDCIVYIKRRSNKIINMVTSILEEMKLNYRTFLYGSYHENDYKYCLDRTKFMLVIDAHESQGFALEEAMSSGVPLLVMDATSMYDEMVDGIHSTYEYMRPKVLRATSVPYWSDECGIRLESDDDLVYSIQQMMINYTQFKPRDYILRELSDQVCMRRILDHFKL